MTTEKSTTELEEAYRKFLRLYERFAADRLTISKQGETLGKIIDELKAESSLATEFKVHVRQDVVETMKSTAVAISDQIKNSIQEPITNEVNDLIKKLKGAVNSSIETLHECAELKKEKTWWKVVTTIFGVCLLFVLFFCKFYLPNLYFTSKQLATYKDGIFLNLIWDKLSKKERIRLTAIGRGSLPPEENSIEWIRKQNPSISSIDVIKKFDEQ